MPPPIVILVFGIVLATSVGGWYFFDNLTRKSDLGKLRARLNTAPDQKPDQIPVGSVALFEVAVQPRGRLIPTLLEKYDLGEKIRALSEQAGVRPDPVRFAQTSAGSFLLGYFVAWTLLPARFTLFALLVAAIAGGIPLMLLRRKRASRVKKFEEVFPDALEFIARSMRAGHAFSVSLEMIHKEFSDPVAGEFRRTFEEHNLGLPLDTALLGMSRRVPLLDVHFFVSAVMLQKRTGGNLAEILDKLGYVIRERFKLRGRIKAIAAHGRMTGTALTCIPIGVGALMFFVNPDYVRFFFLDETGNLMIGGAVLFQVIGYLVIQKIVNIEV